ncbi:MAG: PorT family protein [Chitinophagaceae bacterium]|nr:MAG: PorT family protein [Chitinophagaceae bacterium]
MKHLFAFIIVMGSILVNAQTGVTYKKLAWGIRFAPGLSYRSLHFGQSQQQLEQVRNKQESAAFGFSAGLQFLRGINDKSAIEGGIAFSNSGYRIAKAQLSWEQPNPALPTEATFSYRYQHIHLNAGYRCELFGSKMKVYVAPSLYGGILIQRKTIVKTFGSDDTDRSISKTRGGYREGDFGLQFAAGVAFRLPSRLMLSLQPYYRRSFTSILPGASDREYLYAFGLETQLHRLRIKKHN